MRRGHSLRSWAKEQGVSPTIIYRILSGARPGIRGESARIRTALLALVRKERAA
jgi:gp16 family phage-associated protein